MMTESARSLRGQPCVFYPEREKKEKERTKDGPSLCEPCLVRSIEDEDHGVAFVVVFLPDGADRRLAAEVVEAEGRGGEGDLADWGRLSLIHI